MCLLQRQDALYSIWCSVALCFHSIRNDCFVWWMWKICSFVLIFVYLRVRSAALRKSILWWPVHINRPDESQRLPENISIKSPWQIRTIVSVTTERVGCPAWAVPFDSRIFKGSHYISGREWNRFSNIDTDICRLRQGCLWLLAIVSMTNLIELVRSQHIRFKAKLRWGLIIPEGGNESMEESSDGAISQTNV